MSLKAAVVALALICAGQVREPKASPTFLAVVDGDGMLTPIAVYDGSTWWNRWPWTTESESIRAMPVPRSLASIPADWLPPGLTLPRTWRVMDGSSHAVGPVRAVRVRRAPETAIMDTFVIETTGQRHRSIASEELVAISGPGTLGRFVAPPVAEQRRILSQLSRRIETLEREQIATWRRESNTSRDAVLTRIYMVETPERTTYVTERPDDAIDFGLTKAELPIGGRTYYYLDGEKLFAMHANDECMMNLSSSGTVVTDARGVVVSEQLASSAYGGYCGDRAESDEMLATLRLGGQTFWVLKNSLEDGYDYLLMNPVTGEPVQLAGKWELRDSGHQVTSGRRW